MTLLTAGEAPRSDGEAMSTGSELSEEGSDGVFSAASSSSVPPSPVVALANGDVSYSSSYDTSVAHVLELHRALAQNYSIPGSKQPYTNGDCGASPTKYVSSRRTSEDVGMNNAPLVPRHGRTVRAMSADLGVLRGFAACQNQMYNVNHCHQQYPPQSYNNQHQFPPQQQYPYWNTTTEQQQDQQSPAVTPTSPCPSTDDSSASTSGSTPSGTPRGKNLKFNLSTISENISLLMRRENHNSSANGGFRARSHSACVPAHEAALLVDSDVDSDEDDDDYGFLSHYSGMFAQRRGSASSAPGAKDCNGHNNNNGAAFVSADMHKVKSPAAPRRLLPKRWRKPKWTPSKEAAVLWTSEGSCTWASGNGRRVTLTPTSLVNLCNVERLALQKISLVKLQTMDLGCAITIPKDGFSQKRSKRSAFSLKRKTNSDSSSGWVFGIPLAKVTANDLELRRRKPSSLRERRESLDLAQRHTRKSSSSSVSRGSSQLSCQQSLVSLSVSSSLELLRSFHQQTTGAISSDSLSETDSRSTGGAGSTHGSVQGSNLLDALSLSSSAKLESSWREHRESLAPHTPIVPYLVNICSKHLETYGLNTLGIFRIGSSIKRIKQLREEFDCGKDVKLNEDHNPHDVGALLKEFFRDLPDPLLTRDLYNAFLATRKLQDDRRRVAALSLLVSLLPAVNRDTLWALLTFLSLVVQHSTDTTDADGNQLAGNKMDSHNLAILFGPNILHKAKGGEFEVTSVERAEERHDVIAVVKEMIDNQQRLFEVSAELHDEVMRLLIETNPESADYILRRKCALATGTGEVDPESSSSFYEENDNSSLPCTPSYNNNEGSNMRGRSRSMMTNRATSSATKVENATTLDNNSLTVISHESRSRPSRSLSRSHRAEPPPQLDMLQVPQFRITSPDQGWYRPDSRSPSPMSPRISPSPKAMKSATPDLRIRVPDQPRERASSTNSLIMPRPVRFKYGGHNSTIPSSSSAPSAGGSGSSTSSTSVHTLTVPCGYMGLKRDHRDSDSSSSLSSYYPSGTSRSATNSPITPDAPHHAWSMETPSSSPKSPPNGGGSGSEQLAPHDAIRTPSSSSRQRPLGLNLRVSSSPRSAHHGQQQHSHHHHHHSTTNSSEERHNLTVSSSSSSSRNSSRSSSSSSTRDWQKQKWKQWEMIAKEHSDEPETLV